MAPTSDPGAAPTDRETRMRMTRRAALAVAIVGLLVMLGARPNGALAHRDKHTPAQLKAFEELFLEQVKIGDLLFHGDEATQKRMGVTLSKSGMSCAMCHPFVADVHPYEFPKFQEQMNQVATLRDIVNWCIEKPNDGVKLDLDSDAIHAAVVTRVRNRRLESASAPDAECGVIARSTGVQCRPGSTLEPRVDHNM